MWHVFQVVGVSVVVFSVLYVVYRLLFQFFVWIQGEPEDDGQRRRPDLEVEEGEGEVPRDPLEKGATRPIGGTFDLEKVLAGIPRGAIRDVIRRIDGLLKEEAFVIEDIFHRLDRGLTQRSSIPSRYLIGRQFVDEDIYGEDDSVIQLPVVEPDVPKFETTAATALDASAVRVICRQFEESEAQALKRGMGRFSLPDAAFVAPQSHELRVLCSQGLPVSREEEEEEGEETRPTPLDVGAPQGPIEDWELSGGSRQSPGSQPLKLTPSKAPNVDLDDLDDWAEDGDEDECSKPKPIAKALKLAPTKAPAVQGDFMEDWGDLDDDSPPVEANNPKPKTLKFAPTKVPAVDAFNEVEDWDDSPGSAQEGSLPPAEEAVQIPKLAPTKAPEFDDFESLDWDMPANPGGGFVPPAMEPEDQGYAAPALKKPTPRQPQPSPEVRMGPILPEDTDDWDGPAAAAVPVEEEVVVAKKLSLLPVPGPQVQVPDDDDDDGDDWDLGIGPDADPPPQLGDFQYGELPQSGTRQAAPVSGSAGAFGWGEIGAPRTGAAAREAPASGTTFEYELGDGRPPQPGDFQYGELGAPRPQPGAQEAAPASGTFGFGEAFGSQGEGGDGSMDWDSGKGSGLWG